MTGQSVNSSRRAAADCFDHRRWWSLLPRLMGRSRGAEQLFGDQDDQEFRRRAPQSTSLIEQALAAVDLLSCGDIEDAQRALVKLRRTAGAAESLEGQYVKRYAAYQLALMRDDRPQAGYEARMAASLKVDRTTRRRLEMQAVSERPKLETMPVATFVLTTPPAGAQIEMPNRSLPPRGADD